MADAPVSTAPPTEVQPVVPAFQELTPAPQSFADGSAIAERQRDATGRFIGRDGVVIAPATPSTTPPAAAPAQPKFSQNLIDLAKSVYYTDDQIAKFDDPSMLFDAVRGRAATMPQPQPQYPPSTPPSAQPVVPTFEPIKLDFGDDELAPEVVKHLRGLEAYTNTTAKKAFDENQQLRQEMAKLYGMAQQSAVSNQQVADQQRAGFWDQVAAAVPGMVEAIGKPSQAMSRLGTPQADEWTEVAPFIAARAQAQRVPEQYIDYVKASQEAWTAYRAMKNNGYGSPHGSAPPAGLPGVAVRSSPRQSTAPTPSRSMTPQEDYAYRMAAMENAFQATGGQNPFSL